MADDRKCTNKVTRLRMEKEALGLELQEAKRINRLRAREILSLREALDEVESAKEATDDGKLLGAGA